MKITLLEWCKQNIEQGNRILKEWTGIDIENNNIDINKISLRKCYGDVVTPGAIMSGTL